MDDPVVPTPPASSVRPGQVDSPPVVPASSVPVAPVVAPKAKEQEAMPAGVPMGVSEKVGGIDVAESDKVAKEEGDEYWENYAREIEIEKEIMEMGGVEKIESGEVKVPEKLAKEMGVKPSVNIQTPISSVTDFSIKGLSLSDDQLSAGLVKPTSTGLRWLVEWFIYQLMKAHYHVQRIKGRVFRKKV